MQALKRLLTEAKDPVDVARAMVLLCGMNAEVGSTEANDAALATLSGGLLPVIIETLTCKTSGRLAEMTLAHLTKSLRHPKVRSAACALAARCMLHILGSDCAHAAGTPNNSRSHVSHECHVVHIYF